MLIFTAIVLGFAGLLLLASGVCWIIFFAVDATGDWRRLAIRIFRIAMVCVLFYVNGVIYIHIVSALRGEPPPQPPQESAESE